VIKKWQATYIAPLQPPTLAIFRSWGSSAGAGRIRPAAANIGRFEISNLIFDVKEFNKIIYGEISNLFPTRSNFINWNC
jgi:hypothetical protein